MAANTPAVGTGAWSIMSGSATITDPSSPTTTVTGIAAGSAVTLRWIISNGVCAPSTDDVTVQHDVDSKQQDRPLQPPCHGEHDHAAATRKELSSIQLEKANTQIKAQQEAMLKAEALRKQMTIQ